MPLLNIKTVEIRDKDIETAFQRGSGPGGQAKNKTSSACRMKHIPTGISVFIENEREQIRNKKLAYEILCGRVQDFYYSQQNTEYADQRKALLGDTGRGGARRTWNLYKSIIIDHVTNKQTNDVKAVLKGRLDLIN